MVQRRIHDKRETHSRTRTLLEWQHRAVLGAYLWRDEVELAAVQEHLKTNRPCVCVCPIPTRRARTKPFLIQCCSQAITFQYWARRGGHRRAQRTHLRLWYRPKVLNVEGQHTRFSTVSGLAQAGSACAASISRNSPSVSVILCGCDVCGLRVMHVCVPEFASVL